MKKNEINEMEDEKEKLKKDKKQKRKVNLVLDKQLILKAGAVEMNDERDEKNDKK